MVEVRLSAHKSASANVCIYHTGNIEFWSYTTMVIRAEKQDDGKYLLNCTGTYSQTTARQICWFLREYFGDLNYYDMKNIASTGELLEAVLTRDIRHLVEVA